MNTELKALLKDELAGEILRFFYANQGSIDSVDGIAAWVNSDREKVKTVLDSFVELDVLQHDSEGGAEGYCYTRNEKMMKDIEGFMEK